MSYPLAAPVALLRIVAIAVAVAGSGCVSFHEAAVHNFVEGYQKPLERGCAKGHGDECWLLGESWLRKSAVSQLTDWPLPVDRQKARESFEGGCRDNSIRACISLIERHLLDDQPAKRDATLAQIQAVGGIVRSDGEVADADKALSSLVVEVNERTAGRRAALTAQDRENWINALNAAKSKVEHLHTDARGLLVSRPDDGSDGSAASTAATRYAPAFRSPKGGSSPPPSAPPQSVAPPAVPGSRCTRDAECKTGSGCVRGQCVDARR